MSITYSGTTPKAFWKRSNKVHANSCRSDSPPHLLRNWLMKSFWLQVKAIIQKCIFFSENASDIYRSERGNRSSGLEIKTHIRSSSLLQSSPESHLVQGRGFDLLTIAVFKKIFRQSHGLLLDHSHLSPYPLYQSDPYWLLARCRWLPDGI